MDTRKVPVSPETIAAAAASPGFKRLLDSRLMPADQWIEEHGSGTLRKNKRIGFSWQSQYRIERAAWEFGWCYEMLPKTRVSFNDPISAGDCKACTEAGWHIERIMSRNPFDEDIYEVKYIHANGSGGKGGPSGPRQGLGLIVKQTCAPWIPRGHVIFAFISEYDPETHEWSPPENPC